MDIDRAIAIANGAVEAGATSAPVIAATVPNSILVIDGDGFNYSCAGSDDTSPAWARTRLLDRINGLKQTTGAERVEVHLTYPGSNKRMRYAIASVKPYQLSRKTHKPKNWQFLRDVLEAMPEAKSWGDREADDGIAMTAFEYASAGHTCFIASADKDMRMLPGIHVHLETYEQVPVPLDAWDVQGWGGKQFGRKWFYLQMLHGDAVDNIPGLERWVNLNGKPVLCGEKTAAKILEFIPDSIVAMTAVATCYQDYYGDAWADRMVEQAALLWLSQDSAAGQWVPPEFMQIPGLRDALHRLVWRVYAPTEDN